MFSVKDHMGCDDTGPKITMRMMVWESDIANYEACSSWDPYLAHKYEHLLKSAKNGQLNDFVSDLWQ